jgi:dTDP-4-amino-4,6-dideoxygalactose transaminase
MDHAEIAEARRQNYQTLEGVFEGGEQVRALLGPLPAGACPWLYPVWVEDEEPLSEFLRANGVESERFWTDDHPAAPLDDFPFERSLRRHVLTLPVHQGLGAESMTRMGDLLNRWNRSRG